MSTRADVFRGLVKAYVKVDGQQYITSDSEIDVLIARALRRFTREVKCLYSPSVAFAIQSSVATYNMEGTTNPVTASGTLEWADITTIMVNNDQLDNVWLSNSPSSIQEIQAYYPTYPTDPSGMPHFFMMIPPSQIFLYPTPDQAYANSYISGYRLHKTLSGDSDTLEFPDDYVEVAARFCALELIAPYAAGASEEKRQRLIQQTDAEMRELSNKQRRKSNLNVPRGSVWYGPTVRLR